jgi:hypothetical protein
MLELVRPRNLAVTAFACGWHILIASGAELRNRCRALKTIGGELV